MDNITGTLQNWVKVGQVIYAELNGSPVRIDKIEDIDGDIVYTLNSIYKLGVPKP